MYILTDVGREFLSGAESVIVDDMAEKNPNAYLTKPRRLVLMALWEIDETGVIPSDTQIEGLREALLRRGYIEEV